MLKYQLSAEEHAQLDDAQKALYQQSGENYQLIVDGLPQSEDVTGLKTQLDTLLAEKKSEQAKRRQAEEEARQRAEEKAKAEGDYKQLFESSQATTTEWQQKYQDLQHQIEQGTISQAASKVAISIADGENADILSEFISRRLKVVEGQVRVTDANGNLTVSSIEQLAEEFKNTPRYASLVRGSGASGGGAANFRGGAMKEPKEMSQQEREEFATRDPQGYAQALAAGKFRKY
ncbi:hypothetical protein [Mixta mediterraneensis]|uniref:hypothetical protein n=1 Tax=Mixta mediterraneensis TaxID=2758443 RepID=UPI0018744DD0|nr:hypothetical protein [Mixta mediterraneensis]MBE5254519.1 hypothetical protein [Mixta mediterraneensis]